MEFPNHVPGQQKASRKERRRLAKACARQIRQEEREMEARLQVEEEEMEMRGEDPGDYYDRYYEHDL